jgi:ribosomal protein L40E
MTTAYEIEHIGCRHCYAVLDVSDNFCRHCGAPTKNMPSASVPAVAASQRAPWSENRWIVLASLFLVLGPLGLPMLWRSRQFSMVWKLVFTGMVLGLTVLIFVLIWYVIDKALAPLKELRGMQGF